MRFILAIIFLLAFTSGVFAQYGIGAVYYGISFPLEDLRDYISDTSWRGFGVEGRKFITHKTSVGIAWQWNTFEQQSDDALSLDLEDISSPHFRRIYATSILATVHYYSQSAEGYRNVLPYLGLGMGAFWIQKGLEIGTVDHENSNWHFALVPEAGIVIPMGYDSNLFLGFKYNYAFESGDAPSYAYWNINVGIAYTM